MNKLGKSYLRKVTLIFILALPLFADAQNNRKSYYDSMKVMPDFTFYNMKGQEFTNDSLSRKCKIVFMYFKTSCTFCAEEMEIILKSEDKFDATKIYLISREDSTSLKQYYEKYQLGNHPNIKILEDKKQLYYTYYNAHYTPSIHIYSKKHKLIFFTEGVIKKQELIGLLSKEGQQN